MATLPSLLRRGLVGLLPALLASPSLLSQDPATPYRLFVGVDHKLKDGETADHYRRIDALKANQVVLDEPGHPTLPLRSAGAFSWEHKPRISRTPVTIADLEQRKAFTISNDQKMAYLATQNHMAIYQQEKTDAARLAAADERYTQMIRRSVYVMSERDYEARMKMIGVNYTPGGGGGLNFENPGGVYGGAEVGPLLRDANQDVFEAEMDLDNQLLTESTTPANLDFLDRAQATQGGEDVLELSFQLSSPVPVADAYVVVMGAVTQGEEEGVVVFHQPVGAIGPEPRKISVRKTGFQPGFTIKDVKLHVYIHGKELGTNLSEKAVPLTPDQARGYLLLSHVASHQFDTLGPAPVWELVPPAVLANKDAKAFDYPVVVNIDADGSVISIHDDERAAQEFLNEIRDAATLRQRTTPEKAAASLGASVRVADAAVALDQTGRLPPRIVAAIQDMVFLPAIDLGQPQPGTTRVNLAEFYR